MECFQRHELLNWNGFQETYTAVLREGIVEEPSTQVFAMNKEGEEHWKDFHKKLIEHVCQKYKMFILNQISFRIYVL